MAKWKQGSLFDYSRDLRHGSDQVIAVEVVRSPSSREPLTFLDTSNVKYDSRVVIN